MIINNNMKDIKEAHSDAVEYGVDIFSAEYLKQVLIENLDDSLTYWAEFENALYEAADNPTQEEELKAMDREIAEIVVQRVADDYMVVKADDYKAQKLHINEMQKTITVLQDNIEMMKFDAQALRDKYRK